jgi:hypothetical protein
VSLSSSAHRTADVDLEDPNFGTPSTTRSLLTDVPRRPTSSSPSSLIGVTGHVACRAAAVHPGGINTELGRHVDAATLVAWVTEMNVQLAAAGKPPFQLKSVPQGAATSIWAGVVASADEVGGNTARTAM